MKMILILKIDEGATMNTHKELTFILTALFLLVTTAVSANGRNFTYAYQTGVLPSVLPQLPALSKEGGGSGPDLDHNEAVSARLLFSFEL